MMVKCKQYELRTRNLAELGFSTYREYLASYLWDCIRSVVLKRRRYTCDVCGAPATQVHHKNYNRKTLLGRKLNALMAVCRDCHTAAEFDEDGRKVPCGVANVRMERMMQCNVLPKKKRVRSYDYDDYLRYEYLNWWRDKVHRRRRQKPRNPYPVIVQPAKPIPQKVQPVQPGGLITKKVIQDAKTERGGWSRLSLASIGVSWPPRKGWKRAILGKPIPENPGHTFYV